MKYALQGHRFPIESKKQAISAVAYAKKLAKPEYHKLSAKERDIVLKHVHAKYPSIHIEPVTKKKK
jgi:alpha-ketoglutarate-dependent taurine dioxygenase